MDIFDNLESKNIPKGAVLLHQGEICTIAYKVLKGCLRSYVIDKSGKEHILQFTPEGWFVSDMDSFFNKKPSIMFIDAIEDSEVLLITKHVLDSNEKLDKATLIEQNERLFRNLISTNKRLIHLLSSSAEERYIDFIETYPTLLQRLPLKLIASYLGMTPEYLSEVRRKLAKK